MVEILRLPLGPLAADFTDRLVGRTVFLSRPFPPLEEALEASSVPFALASDELPDGAVLILVSGPLDQLSEVVDRLYGPGGCPWDQAQTHESLKKYIVEEAYEVIEAIDSGSASLLREELGDLLLQPYMHAQMRKLRTGEFDIDDVAQEIVTKLIRRHPHVFGETSVADADEVLANWDVIKKAEKGEAPASILGGVPRAMPSLMRAYEISKRAARVGFEWPNQESVFDKLHEEEQELRAEIEAGNVDRIESELGDLLFAVVNLARWQKIEPEEALRKMVDRFTSRFERMEALATVPLRELGPEQWDALWNAAKRG